MTGRCAGPDHGLTAVEPGSDPDLDVFIGFVCDLVGCRERRDGCFRGAWIGVFASWREMYDEGEDQPHSDASTACFTASSSSASSSGGQQSKAVAVAPRMTRSGSINHRVSRGNLIDVPGGENRQVIIVARTLQGGTRRSVLLSYCASTVMVVSCVYGKRTAASITGPRFRREHRRAPARESAERGSTSSTDRARHSCRRDRFQRRKSLAHA